MSVENLGERLYLPPPKRSVRPVFEAAAGHVPVLGDYVVWQLARERAQRDDDLQAFCEKVASVLNDVCKQIDDAKQPLPVDGVHLWSQDFFRFFSSAAHEYVVDRDTRKREYLLAFVVNYSREKRPDVTLAQVFWSVVRELSGTHMLVLSILHGAQKSLSREDLQNLRPERRESVSLRALAEKTAVEITLLEVITQTLQVRGLVRRTPGPTAGDDLSERVVLEDIGLQFMDFLTAGGVMNSITQQTKPPASRRTQQCDEPEEPTPS